MKVLKKGLKYFFYILLIPVSYVLIALVLTSITVNETNTVIGDNTIFLNTNGVHLDVILPIDCIEEKLLKNIESKGAFYITFGWGDENFYLNTPTWGDLTFNNAFKAMFLESTTLLHLTNYNTKKEEWVAVKVSDNQLKKINTYIVDTFEYDANGSIIMLEGKGYSNNDNFYKAKGSYSCLKTCNTWVNSAFKTSGVKSCYWTPFDFGLINKYKN